MHTYSPASRSTCHSHAKLWGDNKDSYQTYVWNLTISISAQMVCYSGRSQTMPTNFRKPRMRMRLNCAVLHSSLVSMVISCKCPSFWMVTGQEKVHTCLCTFVPCVETMTISSSGHSHIQSLSLSWTSVRTLQPVFTSRKALHQTQPGRTSRNLAVMFTCWAMGTRHLWRRVFYRHGTILKKMCCFSGWLWTPQRSYRSIEQLKETWVPLMLSR